MMFIEIFNIYFKPHNLENFQQNLIILKYATIYICSSTTAYEIGRANKLKKTENDFTTPLILLQHIQPLHIVPKISMKTLT